MNEAGVVLSQWQGETQRQRVIKSDEDGLKSTINK